MLWLFQILLFHEAAIKEGDSCGTPGYLNNFTYHPLKLISGYNLQIYRDVSTDKETLRATCEGYCLSNSICISYEIDFSSDDCYISNYDMYDIALDPSNVYDFYNRVYDCGCPPNQGDNVINSYTSTTDGSSLNIVCSTGSRSNVLPRSLTCTSDGWGVSANIYSCIVQCLRPANVTNASHNGTLTEYEVGDIVTYTCNTGYVNLDTKGTDTIIQCQNDGTWEEIPICIIDCGPPENISNAVVTNGDIFTPGQSVEYTCNSGYVMSDTKLSSKSITCKDDGIWENPPSCIVKCGAASSISNAMVSPGDTFIPGENVTYTCDPNYVIEGTKTNAYSITCQDDGTWSIRPNCIRYCGSPPAVAHSKNNAMETLYVYEEKVEYTCDTGYVVLETMLSNATLTCMNTGLWELAPICTVSCGRPENIEDGTVTDGNMFIPGHNVTYTCASGYVIKDTKTQSQSSTCKDDGTWEQKPSCSVNCGAAPSASNSVVTSGSVFIPGESVIYTCNPSYVVEGTKQSAATVMCQNDGNWTSSPSCIKDCGPSPNVANSSNDAVGTVFVHGDTVTYSCDSGFVMIDTLIVTSTLTCQDDGFWQNAPQCIVSCGSPEALQHATVTSGDTFTPGQTVTYTCASGYVISETKTSRKSIACDNYGQWETKPSCVVNCGVPPTVRNAFLPSGSIYIPGDDVTITCDPSYVIVGTKQSKATITCNNNGNWDQNPMCTKDCGPPPTVPHSTNNASGTVYVPNEQVTYTCNNNYIMLGSLQPQAAVTCQNNGRWSDTPICIVNCGPPPSVQHAAKSSQGSIFTPGDYITWRCDDRYVVQATNIISENVICKGDGTWTTKPRCIAYCGEHPDVDHAQVQGTGSQQGDSRTYTCTEGHTMVGSAVIQCQSNSVWEETPICPADCGDPPVLNKGSLTGLGNLENDTRNATCGNGYVLEGTSIIKCQMNGQWEDLPQCTATEVHKFKESMFGAEKSPISQQTGIAMTFAIVFGILLIGVGSVYCYNICKQKQKDRENKQTKSSEHNSKGNGSLFHINGSFNASAEDNTYLPVGSAYKKDRSWREIFF